MLDAILAMALTLGALATIATIVMEACLRTARMRKKNLAEVMKLLNEELDKGPLGLSPKERTQFITGVIRNPAREISKKLIEKIDNSSPEDLLKYIGYDRDREPAKSRFVGVLQQFFIFVGQLIGDKKRAGLYDSVTMEHVLRRLAEVETVQRRSRQARKGLKIELNRLARKYEEFSSAVSASFKRHAQAWSIAVGIVLALVVNIDGLRIFQAYLENKELSQTVIAQQDLLLSYNAEAKSRQKEFDDAVKLLEDANKAVEAAVATKDKQDDAAAKQKLEKAEALIVKLASPEKIKQELESASKQLDSLVVLGIPFGWRYYPNCRYGEIPVGNTLDKKCRELKERYTKQVNKTGNAEASTNDTKKEDVNDGAAEVVKGNTQEIAEQQSASPKNESSPRWIITRVLTTASYDVGGFIRWFFAVVLTGLLIGLGAPFWFDVAKRLAGIRSGKRDAASAEFRMAANNANGDNNKRKEIVDAVVTDAAGEQRTRVTHGELARLVADTEIDKQIM